jgi:hypothetical protein
MSVDALQLKPRNAIALFDAALRVCATSSGVWAATLPSGALLLGALIHAVQSALFNHSLVIPTVLFTLSWLFRAVSFGAACHHLEHELLGSTRQSVALSFRAAFRRFPSLVTTAAWLAVFNVLVAVGTFGIGFLFLGAHTVAYAITMRGLSKPFGLYAACAQSLGPARRQAPLVNALGAVQIFVFFNLHFATALLLMLAEKLLGLDVVFLNRYASIDNPMWLTTLVMITFALFEPVRAALATLLLIDGQVRMEALDLLAQVEQLPKLKRRNAVSIAVVSILMLSAPAFAAQTPVERLNDIFDDCKFERVKRVDLKTFEEVPAAEQSSTARLLKRLEKLAYDDDDCESAERNVLSAVEFQRALHLAAPKGDPKAAIQSILNQPEFMNPEEAAPVAKSSDDSWWSRFLKWLFAWLDKDRLKQLPETPPGTTPMFGANLVMLGAVILVVVILAAVLFRSLRKPPPAPSESLVVSQEALTQDRLSALARAPESWAGLADQLAAQGHYREAIRHLYLALLSHLHRSQLIDYDTTASNWEYVKGFRGPSASRVTFRTLTSRFDFVWYGNTGAEASHWRDFRTTAQPLIQLEAFK